MTLSLSQATVDKLRTDNALRLMIFCAAERKPGDPPGPVNMALPHQLELKVNGEELKGYSKGLKNKPGTTKPIDITAFVRTKLAGYKNQIVVMYALTKEKYSMNVMLVKTHTVNELAEKIRNGRVISKQRVLDEMRSKANDPDIVATSTVISLKDPVSFSRISIPCRSTICGHNHCFDAHSFLSLQMQMPTWTCPICNKNVTFEALAVDQYMQDILQRTSSSAEQVTVEPDGRWSVTGSADTSKSGAADDDDYDSDDCIEIPEHRMSGSFVKKETPVTPYSFSTSPPAPSPAANQRSAAKRKSEVIDLTLSDEDEPVPKRQNTNTNGLNGYHQTARHDMNRNYSASSSSTAPNGFTPFSINNNSSSRTQQPGTSFALPTYSGAPTPPQQQSRFGQPSMNRPGEPSWRTTSSPFSNNTNNNGGR